MTTLTLLLLAAGAAGKPVAQTPSLPNRAILLVVPQEGSPPSPKFTSIARRALEDEGVKVVVPGDVFKAPEVKDEAAKLVQAGKEAYDNLDVDVAGTKFKEALAWYTANPAAATATKLAEVHLLIAAVALQNGGKNGVKLAQEDWGRALTYDPAATLDPKYFAPDTKKPFDKAKAELAGRVQGKLMATSTPPAPATWRDRPLTGTMDVVTGRHLVTFALDGYSPAGTFVDVTKAGVAEAKAELQPAPGFDDVWRKAVALTPAAFGGKKLPPEAASMATASDSRYVLLVSAGTLGGSLEVWDPETGNRLTNVLFEGEAGLPAAAIKVKNFISSPSPLSGKNKPVASIDGEPGNGTPLYKQWWLWAAVGGVVVVGAASAGIAVAASQPKLAPFNPALNF